MKIAAFFYALAVLSLPIGSASKLLFGQQEMVWIDPTLIFSALAFLALIPAWRKIDTGCLRPVTTAVTVLTVLCLVCAGFGFLLRPTAEMNNALREPLRLVLTMIWMVTSCWFLRARPAFTVKFTAIAALLGLASGIYIYLAAFGTIPASATAIVYSRRYLIQQAVWYDELLVPRMGGLFVEAPPFGLCMMALGAVLWAAHRSGIRSKVLVMGFVASAVGVIASLAGQVLLGAGICVSAMVLSSKTRRTWLKPLALCIMAFILVSAGWQSLVAKGISQANATTTSRIYADSVGERNFHLNYGLSLLERDPLAALLGIGPGRYGEYVAETGYFTDTTTMQFTAPELLVEWGVVGLGVWLVIVISLGLRVNRIHAIAGVCVLFGLLVADSFQANWKSEAVFLAIAALCTPFGSAEPIASEANKRGILDATGLDLAGAEAHG